MRLVNTSSGICFGRPHYRSSVAMLTLLESGAVRVEARIEVGPPAGTLFERKGRAYGGMACKTPEERTAMAKKAWVTRRRNLDNARANLDAQSDGGYTLQVMPQEAPPI